MTEGFAEPSEAELPWVILASFITSAGNAIFAAFGIGVYLLVTGVDEELGEVFD